ncbi:hypothetical protein CISIN_1g036189mg [Citrus sinensis]|uniref:Late embryogenesis abundant protein LEA-2 subgroup domain-containing protein n=1 Tax=Citrus sinensis TaxID=2711 RepID=A0A067DB40_CITSI|nr:hypothetical protein CISIN_1g036189mg [Citrus sinensis]
MEENEIIQNSAHRCPSKVYPLTTGDISQLPPSRPPHYQHFQIKKLPKLIIITLLVVAASISLTALICILMYFTLGPKLPSLHLDTFSVSNFTIGSTNLIAKWDFNLTFKNPDHLWQIYLDYIECIALNHDHFPIAINHSVSPPFKVKPMKKSTIHVQLATGDSLIFLNHQLLQKINSQRRNGRMVVFGLAVRAKTRFTGVSWLWWTEFANLMYTCLDLKVGFKGLSDSDVGMFIGRLPKQC